MISSLRGRAAHVDTDSLVVEVGGVGLTVAVTPHVAHATNVGDEFDPKCVQHREELLAVTCRVPDGPNGGQRV